MKEKQDMIDPRTLRVNLCITQLIVLLVAAIGSNLLYEWPELLARFRFPAWPYMLWALVLAVLGAGWGALMDRWLPERWLDDGAINQRIFQGLSPLFAFLLCLLIGIAEEWLFRGVVQPLLGNGITSLLFSVIHFRYLRKPILLITVYATSYLLGLLFAESGSLLPPIAAHTLLNFISALLLTKKRGGK